MSINARSQVDTDLRKTVGKLNQIGLTHLGQNVEWNDNFISRGLKPLRVSAVIPHGLGGVISLGSHREEGARRCRQGIRHIDNRPEKMSLGKGKSNKSDGLQEGCNPGKKGRESESGRGWGKEEGGREERRTQGFVNKGKRVNGGATVNVVYSL